jgi:hypothetical protein
MSAVLSLVFLFAGLFVPFAKSGKAVVFASLVSLIFGHCLSFGGLLYLPQHQPLPNLKGLSGDNCNNWRPNNGPIKDIRLIINSIFL